MTVFAPGIPSSTVLGQVLAQAGQVAEAGRVAEACAICRWVLTLAPAFEAALALLGLITSQPGQQPARDPDHALIWLRRALALRPDSAIALGWQGDILMGQQRFDEAADCFRRALLVDPDNAFAYFNMGGAMGMVDAQAMRAAHGTAPEAVVATLRARVAARADDLAAWVRLGPVLERLGDEDAALAAYRQALVLKPDHGRSNNRRALIEIRRAWGRPARPPRSVDPRPRISMTTLGENGRFGNQIVQYGFLRCYAATHGFRVETGDWIGRDLFAVGEPDPDPAAPLPRLTESDLLAAQRREDNAWLALPGVDFYGLFASQRHYRDRHRALYQGLFTPVGRAAALESAWTRLRAGRTVVAVHLRRSDAVTFPKSLGFHDHFWVAPEAWYRDWLRLLWPNLSRPLLYVASDQPGIEEAFAEFAPVTAADLGVSIPGAGFYPDFFVLSRADLVAVSNSTFSFAASLLNTTGRLFVAPNADAAGLCPYQPWQRPTLADDDTPGAGASPVSADRPGPMSSPDR